MQKSGSIILFSEQNTRNSSVFVDVVCMYICICIRNPAMRCKYFWTTDWTRAHNDTPDGMYSISSSVHAIKDFLFVFPYFTDDGVGVLACELCSTRRSFLTLLRCWDWNQSTRSLTFREFQSRTRRIAS